MKEIWLTCQNCTLCFQRISLKKRLFLITFFCLQIVSKFFAEKLRNLGEINSTGLSIPYFTRPDEPFEEKCKFWDNSFFSSFWTISSKIFGILGISLRQVCQNRTLIVSRNFLRFTIFFWGNSFSRTFGHFWKKIPNFWRKFFIRVVKTVFYVSRRTFCAKVLLQIKKGL